MRIESQDPRFGSTADRLIFDINYGDIKTGGNTTVDVFIHDAIHLKSERSCGCTEPQIEIQFDGSPKLSIIYDNNKTGIINQYVIETVLDNQTGKEVDIRFNLKGTQTA